MTTLIPKFDLMNGGSTPTGAINRAINLKLAEMVSAKDFGAVGDGITDDTVAIRAFFANVQSNSCNFLPAGNYLVNSFTSLTLTGLSNVEIIGEGATITINADQSTTTYMLSFVNCTNVTINNLDINGNAYIANPFYFSGCNFVQFLNNTFQKLWRTSSTVDGIAFYCSNGTNFQVTNNTFYRVNKAIVFDDDGTNSTNVVISGNTIDQGGFAAITTAHVNCVVDSNTIRYASLGPFASRTDMRNASWTPTLTSASYGTGKGAAINSGSNTYASGSYPLNLTITNNIINYVAEYAIGIESGDYVGATQLAGPAINTVISNNNIRNTGVNAIFLVGMNGVTVSGNIVQTAGLSLAGDAAILLATRTGNTTSQVNNGIRNAVVSGNVVVDTTGVTQKAFYFDGANINGALNGISISNNSVYLSNTTKTWGIQFDNSGSASTQYSGMRITGNYFNAPSASASAISFISGLPMVNSTYVGNRSVNFGSPNNLYNTFYQYSTGLSTNSVEDANVNYPYQLQMSNSSGSPAIWTTGTGSPEGVLTAPIGSLYTNLTGSTSTTLYVKTSGTGNTGWTAK